MRLVLTIFWIILAFFILWIFSLNVGQTVDVNFFFTEFKTVNLVTVTFSSLFIGFTFGIIFFLIQFAKSKKEVFQLKKQIKILQAELSSQNNQAEPEQIEGPTSEDVMDSDIKNPEKND